MKGGRKTTLSLSNRLPTTALLTLSAALTLGTALGKENTAPLPQSQPQALPQNQQQGVPQNQPPSVGVTGTETNSTDAAGVTLPGTTLPATDQSISDQSISETPLPDQPLAPAVALPFTLTIQTPSSAQQTVLFQPLPEGAAIVTGSVTLNGEAAPDPLISTDGAYFVFPGSVTGTLKFSASGTHGPLALAGLRVHYRQGQQETLQGTFDEAAFQKARPTIAVAERAGIIRSPLDGAALRARRSVNVVLDVPLGQNPSGALSVNGTPVPDSQVGTRTLYSDGHTRLAYVAVPLEVGDNLLSAFGDQVHVRTADAASQVRVRPLGEPVADGSTPPTFSLDVQDARGNGADLPSVSVTVTGGEPLSDDADPNQSGYQVRIQNGHGQLALKPLSLPGVVVLDFEVNGHTQTERVQVGQGHNTVMIVHSGGVVSAGHASFQGAATVEAPILGGKLYVAANSDGVNQKALPYSRYPAYGDASSVSQPLHAQGKVAARLVLPNVHAEFGQDAATDPVFDVQTGADGLNAETNGQTRAGFGLTQVPGDQVQTVLIPDGTRVLRLAGAAVPGSETVILVRSLGGVETQRRTLSRGLDYVLGGEGLLEFPAPLLPVDAKGQDQRLLVTYRGGQGGQSSVNASVHLTHDLILPGVTGSVSVGGVLIGSVPSFGVHVRVASTAPASTTPASTAPPSPLLAPAQTAAEALVAASGGAVYGSLLAAYQAGKVQAGVSARYEGSGYTGPGAGSPGVNVNAAATYALDRTFALKVNVTGTRRFAATVGVNDPLLIGTGASGLNGAATSTPQDMDVVVAAGLSYHADPFTADLLLRRNFSASGFGVQASLGYASGGTELSVSHAQDFGAGQSLTTVTASALLAPDLKLGFSANRDWHTGLLGGGLTLSGVRGGVNYVAGYDLPSEGGTLGRARIGATTSVLLAPGLNGDLAAGVSSEAGLTGSVGATLRYQDAGTQASLGTDAALSDQGSKFDLKAAVNVSYGSQWTLAADGLSEFGSGVPSGNRFGLGLSWRGDNAAALGSLRFRNGSFGEDQVTGELDLEQRPDFRSTEERARQQELGTVGQLERSRLQLRESLALAVPLGGASPTIQGLAGMSYWLSDTLAIGAGAGVAYQSGSPLGTRLGLEATFVPLSGLSVTAGYNFLGFASDLGRQPTQAGAYLKFDLLIDEVHR